MVEGNGTHGVDGDLAGLIRKAKAYDRSAFAELYRLTLTPVYRYVAARMASTEEAEELTQEVFVAALSAVRGLRAEDEAGLMGWLFQISRHKIADHLRRRYRRTTSSLDGDEDLESPSAWPDEVVEADEERAELRRALGMLTAEQREVIVCKYVLEYDNQMTARLVGKNANAVNQLHHRALASLHRLLVRTRSAR